MAGLPKDWSEPEAQRQQVEAWLAERHHDLYP
jgi:hypothetical protein